MPPIASTPTESPSGNPAGAPDSLSACRIGTAAAAGGPVPARVFVGLGANLGDARATLLAALADLRALAETAPGPGPAAHWRVSSLWRSAPVDACGPDFHNAVASFDSALEPHALLDALQAIEARFGRERPFRNAPRTLDLDLLLYDTGHPHAPGGLQYRDARLALPHPRAHLRAFVLAPLAELWPEGAIPGQGRVVELLDALQRGDAQRIERLRGRRMTR